MSSLIDRLNSRIELFRLEQRYIKQRTRRSTFRSDAVYVDGEYIYSSRPADENSASPTTSSHRSTSISSTPKTSSFPSTRHPSFSSSSHSTPSSPTSSKCTSTSSSPSSSPSKPSGSSRFSRRSKGASGVVVRLSPVDDDDDDDYEDRERDHHVREKTARRKSGLWNGFGTDLGSARRREEKASARAMVAVREVVYIDE